MGKDGDRVVKVRRQVILFYPLSLADLEQKLHHRLRQIILGIRQQQLTK